MNIQIGFKYVTLCTLISVLTMFDVGINSQAWSQTTDKRKQEMERLDSDIKLEQKRKAAADAKKARIEAERAAAEAVFPKLDSSKAPTGKISADDKVTFENQVLAYQSMNRVMDKLINEIRANIVNQLGKKISLIVFKEQVVPYALAKLDYELFKARVDSIAEDYEKLIPRNPISSNSSVYSSQIPAATAGFLFDLLPFFRVDKTFKGTSINVSTKAFVAKLVSGLREAGESNISVYYPDEYSLITEDAVDIIVADISNLQNLKQQAQNNSKLTDTQRTLLQKANQSFDALIVELTNKDKGKNLLKAITSSLSLQNIANSKQNDVYFLSVKILAGGTNRTSKTFFRNRLRHSGGVIVKYTVYDKDGWIVLSNVHDSYTGFSKVRDSQ